MKKRRKVVLIQWLGGQLIKENVKHRDAKILSLCEEEKQKELVFTKRFDIVQSCSVLLPNLRNS